MTRRGEEDAIVWAAAGVLALIAIAGIVTSIILFTKKKTLAGILVMIGSIRGPPGATASPGS